jgi:hypothetical protein
VRLHSCLLTVTVISACSLSPEVPGTASVLGQVLQSSGQPLASSTVAIECRGGSTITVPTDTTGWYGGTLSAPVAGRMRCVFAVPDFVAPRIRVDTTVYFGPNGQLHSLQVMHLRETVTR